MVIVELIGSISLAIAFISVVVFAIVQIKNKQYDITYTHEQTLNKNDDNKSFKEIKELPMINVINNDEISSTSIKYGIQWTLPSDEDDGQSKKLNILNEGGDSISLNDQTLSVRNLIEKFETHFKEKNNQLDSDITSIDTDYDNQTIKINLNANRSSISNLNVTIPSNLSSSIDLEQFDCFSTTSNISEYLDTN